MTDKELQKIAEIPTPEVRSVKMVFYSDYVKLELYCHAQEEKLRIARDLLMQVDNGAQKDFNGVNWYDAREEFFKKLEVK